MRKDRNTADAYLQQFLHEAAKDEIVWGLYCKDGWANCDSHEYDETVVYPFWSNKELAKACASNEWGVYKPEPLALPEFLENWCIGMYKEYIVAGANWDNELFGKEIEPLELALLLLKELSNQKKQLKFKFYKSQAEFEEILIEIAKENGK